MNKFNDEKIIKNVKNSENYQIKTTSSSILYSYNNLKKEEPKKTSHKKYFVLGGLGTLVLASSIALVSVLVMRSYGSNNGEENINIFDPSKNASLANELITFSSFSNENSSIKSLALYKNEARDNATQQEFETVVNKYDTIESGVKDLFLANEVKTRYEETSFKYLDITYIYKVELYYENTKEIISTIYYDEDNLDQLKSKSINGLYKDKNNAYFYLNIITEEEQDEDETEKKVSLLFKSCDINNKKVIRIYKESEYEGIESEDVYSYGIYKDEKEKDPYYELVYDIENEEDEKEFEVSIYENNEEYKFKDILEIDSNHYTFLVDDFLDIEFDQTIDLKYQGSNRLYSADGYQTIKK